MVVSADGKRQVTIADRLAPSEDGQITWAPDSRHLAFAAAPADPPLSLSHIYVAQADRPGATELGGPGLAGFEPAWSPDGKQIAFKNLNPVDALWLMDADGSNAHRLTKTPGSGYAFWNPQWSPDGKRLSVPGGRRLMALIDVWTINADGTGERNISKSPEDEWWPTWSPDGAKVAFVRIRRAEDLGSFVVVNRDGSGADPLKRSDHGRQHADLVARTVRSSSVLRRAPARSPPARPGHKDIIVYDLSAGRVRRRRGGDDGTWQRLAN